MKREPDLLHCPCGDAWFDLEAADGQTTGIALDEVGRVIAYAGTPVCQSCRKPFGPPSLKVVPGP